MSMFGALAPAGAMSAAQGFVQGLQPQPQGRRRGVDIGQLGAMILAAYQNPLGIQALQQRAQQQQAQDETKQRHVQREQDMGDRWSMWQRQQEYERANPAPRAPDAFDRSLELGGITDPAQRQRLYRQRAMNLANPMQGVQVYNPETGATEMRFIRPSMDQALPADTPGWEPIEEDEGGAGGQAQAPFADRYSRTAMAESGGRDFTSTGAPVRSPRGALYAMQVMPDTAARPGFGIAPARGNSPAEFNRVGREYIDAMVREFGSEAAGAAAYNYGPARFRRLIARHPNDWRSHLPRETRDYLRRQGF